MRIYYEIGLSYSHSVGAEVRGRKRENDVVDGDLDTCPKRENRSAHKEMYVYVYNTRRGGKCVVRLFAEKGRYNRRGDGKSRERVSCATMPRV